MDPEKIKAVIKWPVFTINVVYGQSGYIIKVDTQTRVAIFNYFYFYYRLQKKR